MKAISQSTGRQPKDARRRSTRSTTSAPSRSSRAVAAQARVRPKPKPLGAATCPPVPRARQHQGRQVAGAQGARDPGLLTNAVGDEACWIVRAVRASCASGSPRAPCSSRSRSFAPRRRARGGRGRAAARGEEESAAAAGARARRRRRRRPSPRRRRRRARTTTRRGGQRTPTADDERDLRPAARLRDDDAEPAGSRATRARGAMKMVKAAFSACPSYERLVDALRTRPLWAIMGGAADAQAEHARGAAGAADAADAADAAAGEAGRDDAAAGGEAAAARAAGPRVPITAGVPIGPMSQADEVLRRGAQAAPGRRYVRVEVRRRAHAAARAAREPRGGRRDDARRPAHGGRRGGHAHEDLLAQPRGHDGEVARPRRRRRAGRQARRAQWRAEAAARAAAAARTPTPPPRAAPARARRWARRRTARRPRTRTKTTTTAACTRA